MTIGRMWRRARQAAFMPEVAASPLARTPYDLRHAAVSTWLNGGVPATTVAEWAGHSVEILLRIYAKCLDGGDRSSASASRRPLATPPPKSLRQPADRPEAFQRVRSQRIANWSARRGGQPGLELTDDGAENAGGEQPRPEWT